MSKEVDGNWMVNHCLILLIMFPRYTTFNDTRCLRQSLSTFFAIPKPLAGHLFFYHTFGFFWNSGK